MVDICVILLKINFYIVFYDHYCCNVTGLPKPYDPVVLDLLQSCGPDLVAYTQKERHHLLDNVWMNLLKASKVYTSNTMCAYLLVTVYNRNSSTSSLLQSTTGTFHC